MHLDFWIFWLGLIVIGWALIDYLRQKPGGRTERTLGADSKPTATSDHAKSRISGPSQ